MPTTPAPAKTTWVPGDPGDPGDPVAEGLRHPLSPADRRRLRRAVVEHASTERRRTHPALLHAGEPGGAEAVLDLACVEPGDPGLRTDLVAALLVAAGGCPDPLLWLTRPGHLTLQDVDARWLAAARAARLESGQPLTMVVVNRQGWRDPRSGLSRTWVRLRLTHGR